MKQIEKIIKKEIDQLKPVYLVSSEDSYLLEKCEEKFLNKFNADDLSDFNITRLEEGDYKEGEFVNKLINQVSTLPLISKKRLVVVKCENIFQKKSKYDDQIIKLLENFPESTILLVIIPGSIDKRLKINKTVKKTGKIIELKPPGYKELDRWISKQFTDKGKKIDKKSIKFLEHMFNNNLKRLATEIEKIITCYYEKELITFDDIKKIISKDRFLKDDIIFSFLDNLSERKKKKALSLLNEMIENGEFPLKILFMISRQIRLLLSVKELKNEIKSPNKIAGILGEHPYPIKKCFKSCENFTGEELELLLEKLLEANHSILTGKYSDKMALEMTLLEF